MMMPNPSYQRELWRARLDRSAAADLDPAGALADRDPRTVQIDEAPALRVHVGHALISLGAWLSGERPEVARRPHQRTA